MSFLRRDFIYIYIHHITAPAPAPAHLRFVCPPAAYSGFDTRTTIVINILLQDNVQLIVLAEGCPAARKGSLFGQFQASGRGKGLG